MQKSATRNSRQQFRRALLAVAISSASLPFTAAMAASDKAVVLQEVVVTTEMRTGDVQDIPISMTALTADQLESKAVQRVEDLQYAAPSLSVTDAAITQSVNIRGIGLASGDPNATNGVGVYIDGLFQPPIVNTLSFYDLADVQVLRGPQGTFSGANSTGGAIMLNSKRPELGEELNGYIQAGAGNYSAINTQGAVGVSLGETVAVRAAFSTRNRDSFYDDVGPANTDAGELDEIRGRLGVLWAPTDSLEFYLKYETSDKDTGGFPNRPLETADFAFGRTDDVRDISYNTDTKHEESDDTILLNAKYTFANGVALNLLGGHQEKEIDAVWDFDSTSILSLVQTQLINEDQDSYEVTLVSPDEADLQWVVGYYYQKNDVAVDIQTPGPRILLDIEKETKGLFGQMGFSVTDNLQVEVGLRKIWFEAAGSPESGGYFGPVSAGPAFPVNGDYDDDDMVGKLSINWTYSDDGLVYASVSKGWKPGGYNNPNENDNFDAEEVTAYELGWKASMMDGAVRTSFALFYSDYESFQFDNVDITSGSSGVKNVGDGKIKGAEFSVEGQFGNLRMDAAMSYVDTELSPGAAIVEERALPSSAGNLPQCSATIMLPNCFDYSPYLITTSGGPMPLAPELSFTAGVEYEFELGDGLSLTPRLNYGWVDEQYVTTLYEDVDLLKSRGLLSAMLTLDSENWQVQAYGRNLTDKEYVSGQYLSPVGGGGVEYYGAPREYGVNFTYNF